MKLSRRLFLFGAPAAVALAPFAAKAAKPAALGSQIRPLCFGYVENVTPVRIGRLVWAVHDGPLLDIPVVYDGGWRLREGVDFSDEIALATAPVAPGAVNTCTASGAFKLATRPRYGLTVDAHADRLGLDVYGLYLPRPAAIHGGAP